MCFLDMPKHTLTGPLYSRTLRYCVDFFFVLLQCNQTALTWAASDGHVKCVALLLAAGAATDIQNMVFLFHLLCLAFHGQNNISVVSCLCSD